MDEKVGFMKSRLSGQASDGGAERYRARRVVPFDVPGHKQGGAIALLDFLGNGAFR
ncbi:MAG: hypothetical protein ACLSAP_06225 [Oscillospiraceae bacterium]